jgi:hypothetical protein
VQTCRGFAVVRKKLVQALFELFGLPNHHMSKWFSLLSSAALESFFPFI